MSKHRPHSGKITVSYSYSKNFVFIWTTPVDVKVHTISDEISWP